MRKILATLLAITMVAVMAVSAFAAPSASASVIDEIIDEDGNTIQEWSDGTIVVTFADEDKDPVVMTDIADHWGKDEITKAVLLGLMIGYPDGKFHPEDNMTVAMIYTVLARIAGAEIETTGDNWIDNVAAWAEEAGIADGSDPTSDATRAQMVAFLAAAAEVEGDAADWAVESGILQGDENGELNLEDNLTRAQFAAILVRYLATK
jgi:hypothetical protein